MSSVNNIVGKK